MRDNLLLEMFLRFFERIRQDGELLRDDEVRAWRLGQWSAMIQDDERFIVDERNMNVSVGTDGEVHINAGTKGAFLEAARHFQAL